MLFTMSVDKQKEEADEDAAVRDLLATNLRTLRIARNISQHDLAELSGLHRNYISEIERGRINLTLSNLRKLAKGVGVPITDFFRPLEENVKDLPTALPPTHRSKRGN